jgi:UDP-N-acetylglucosamine 2-epimerase
MEVSQRIKLLFILHSPTKRKLEATGLIDKLANNKNVELRPRYDYMSFIALIKKSEYVISDGGSNQEECYYLGKPCLLFRNTTEREEGVGRNVLLSKFNNTIIHEFCTNYKQYITPVFPKKPSPSALIIDNIGDLQE